MPMDLVNTCSLLLERTTISVDATTLTYDTTVDTKGTGVIFSHYVLEVANYTNAVTTTLSIINANSVTVWTGAAHDENANYSVPTDVDLKGSYTFRLTLSGVSGGTGTDYLTCFRR